MSILSVIVPCYNEAETLEVTLNDLPKHIDGIDVIEYLIINDGSKDNSLDICNSTTKGKRRVLKPMVFSLEGFLEILETAGAIKCTNGKNPEQAVQPSSLKMFHLMEQYGVPFDINRKYTADEIF